MTATHGLLNGSCKVISINQDSLGIQARKLLVNGQPIGKPVGVVACSAPDMVAAASATLATAAPAAGAGGVFSTAAEVGAAKQMWEAVPVPVAEAPEGSTAGVVQLRHGFYADRCLALQPPNTIAYNPPYRHPTRPNPRPVWSSPWQAVLLPCNATSPTQRWSFLAPGQYPSERKAFFSRRTLSAIINEAASALAGNASVLTLLPETDSRCVSLLTCPAAHSPLLPSKLLPALPCRQPPAGPVLPPPPALVVGRARVRCVLLAPQPTWVGHEREREREPTGHGPRAPQQKVSPLSLCGCVWLRACALMRACVCMRACARVCRRRLPPPPSPLCSPLPRSGACWKVRRQPRGGHEHVVRAKSRSTEAQWRSLRFRLALRTYDAPPYMAYVW